MKRNSFSNILTVIIVILIVVAIIFAIKVYNQNVSNNENNNPLPNKNDSHIASFYVNGATSVTVNSLSCAYIGNDCMISLPKATRTDGEVLGYGLHPYDTEALYKIGDNVKLNQNTKFYVISRKKITLTIGSNVDYLSNKDNSCYIYNTDKKCDVKVPNYNKYGYELRGYSTSSDSTTGYIYPNYTYSIRENTVLYPIYNTLTRKSKINVLTTYTINNSIIEREYDCPSDVSDKYLGYLRKIGTKAPYLLIGSKISFLNENSFVNIWGRSYVGMNYGPTELRLIDVRCSNAVLNDYYATFVHEMSHTWDFYYSTKFEGNITDQDDIKVLFSKYSSLTNRPFREYSYSNIHEFFADAVKYYYLKYSDPQEGYSKLDYPSDIKNTIEKYICIANQDYQSETCQ